MRRLLLAPLILLMAVIGCGDRRVLDIDIDIEDKDGGPGTVVIHSLAILGAPTMPVSLICPSGSTSGTVTINLDVEARNASGQVIDLDKSKIHWSASSSAGSWNGSSWTINQPGTYTLTATHSEDYTKTKSVTVVVIGCTVIPTNVVVTPGTLSLQAPGTNCTNTTGPLSANVPVTWSSSDPSVASVTSTGSTTATVTAHTAGSATITATPVSGNGQPGYANVNVAACPPVTPPTRVLTTIDYTPPGGTLTLGQTQQLTPICKDQFDDIMTCPSGLVWVSTHPAIISVNQSGLVTCVGHTQQGTSAQVSVQVAGGGPSNRHAWNCPATSTLVISPLSPTISLGTVNGVCVAQTQFSATFGGQAVTPTWQTSGGTMTAGGLFQANTAGTYTVTATYQGQTVSTTVTVTGSCQPLSGVTWITINPTTLSLFMAGCPTSGASSRQMGYTIDTFGGATTAVTWESSNPNVATVSSTGVVTSVGVGTATIRVRSVADPTKFAESSVIILACPAPPQLPIVVTVVPESTSCPVDGQAEFDASVTGVPAGSSTAVTWSISDPSKASVRHAGSNTVVIDCLAVGTLSVTARAVADQSKFDVGTLTVNQSQTSVCGVTSINYMSSSYTVAVGQSRTVSVDPPSNWSSSCMVIWYTPNPSRAEILGTDTVRVDGVRFHAGLTARIEGVAPGTTADVYAHVISCASNCTSGNVVWNRTNVFSFRTWTITSASANLANVLSGTEFPFLTDVDIDHEAQRKWMEQVHGPDILKR